jgi:hypothetical protein
MSTYEVKWNFGIGAREGRNGGGWEGGHQGHEICKLICISRKGFQVVAVRMHLAPRHCQDCGLSRMLTLCGAGASFCFELQHYLHDIDGM